MKHKNDLSNLSEQELREQIRKRLNKMSHNEKIKLGLVASLPAVPDSKEKIKKAIELFTLKLILGLVGNEQTKADTIDKMKALGINLAWDGTLERFQPALTEAISSLPMDKMQQAGVFGEPITSEMVEERIKLLEDGQYEHIMETRAEKVE